MRRLFFAIVMLLGIMGTVQVNAQDLGTNNEQQELAHVTKKYKGFQGGSLEKPCKGICLLTCYIEENSVFKDNGDTMVATEGYDADGILVSYDIENHGKLSIREVVHLIMGIDNIISDTKPDIQARNIPFNPDMPILTPNP